jgi:hypothetical protein
MGSEGGDGTGPDGGGSDPQGPGSHETIQQGVDSFTTSIEASLFVVTCTASDGEMSGCLVGFVTQCSIAPPRFLVCLSNENHTYSVASRSTSLAVHLLEEGQKDLAALFAEQTGDMVDKFQRCRWRRGSTGSPLLDDCSSWMEGSIGDRFDVGDHQAQLVLPLVAQGRLVSPMTLHNAPSFHPGHPVPE